MASLRGFFSRIDWPLFFEQKEALKEISDILKKSDDKRLKNGALWISGVIAMMTAMSDRSERTGVVATPETDWGGMRFKDDRYNDVLDRQPVTSKEIDETDEVLYNTTEYLRERPSQKYYVVYVNAIGDDGRGGERKTCQKFLLNAPFVSLKNMNWYVKDVLLHIVSDSVKHGSISQEWMEKHSNNPEWADVIPLISVAEGMAHDCRIIPEDCVNEKSYKAAGKVAEVTLRGRVLDD